MNRRSFLKTGMAAATLAGVPTFGAEAVTNDKAVIFLWLGGGLSRFESFHANVNDVPDVYRSVNGIVTHSDTGLRFGADWENLIARAKWLTTVDSYGHRDSSHNTATEYQLTGQYSTKRGPQDTTEYPGHGAIVSSVFGANHPRNGLPTYVRQGKIAGEDPTFLGQQFKAFDPSNKENLVPKVEADRLRERRELLSGLNHGIGDLSRQAFSVIQGDAGTAFDLDKESDKTKARYGKSAIGDQLLLARRLVESGTRFVTIHSGGFDMHSDISAGMKSRVPPIDIALSALLDDLHDRGMDKDVMVVVTSEFGRTTLNKSNGRDHWGATTPLLLSGGDYQHGRTIGKADKSYVPTDNKLGPIDLQRTIFDHFDIDVKTQRVDSAGRPRYIHDSQGESKLILS